VILRSLLKSGLPDVAYYAPRFRVLNGGRLLQDDVLGDVQQVQVTMQKAGMTRFNLTLTNWEDNVSKFPKFKYSDSETFNIGTELRIEMGYADDLVPLVTGQVATLAPKFPESGTPTIDVSGANSLFRLKGTKPKSGDRLVFPDMADWQVAQEVASRNGIPIIVTREGPIHKNVIQKRDQDEATFLLDLATRNEFDLYMLPDRNTEIDTLHFMKPTDGRDGQAIVVFQFTWGQDLIEFSPKLSVSDQVSSVTVRGWDPRTKRAVEYTATERDLPSSEGSGASGPKAAAKVSPRGKEDVIVDSAVTTEEAARQLAVSRLVQRSYTYKTGSGRVMGQPRMRPGDNLDLQGLGKRFSGMWHIIQVDHTLGESGYTTAFEVERLMEVE
jgi:phage protein D